MSSYQKKQNTTSGRNPTFPASMINTPGGYLRHWERIALIVILLLSWTVRWVALRDVPPGWRDDDVIELYTFSGTVFDEGPVWYYTGASGHEPLFHTLRAPIVEFAGINIASARWMSATFGTLAVLLTWAIGRRMFTRMVGMLAALTSSLSFWSLMYSRVAIRHIGVLPWMLLAIYWAWRILQDHHVNRKAVIGIVIGTTGSILTYYAGRLIPPLLLVMLPCAGLPLNKERFRNRWLPLLIGLAIGCLVTVPMFLTSASTGGDARVGELAIPITSLLEGNPRPILETTWTTLGMAHAKGDPEWLYNISERPVLGWLGSALLYIGILTRLAHLDQANARFTLVWLGAGLAPAFISYPPSSLGHTILAFPAVYLLLSMPMKAAVRRWRWVGIGVAVLTIIAVAARDLPDYFITWPQDPLVRFLYRADYRAAADYLDEQLEITDVSIGSMVSPWDKVAFQTDSHRDDLNVRWFNPDRSLVFDIEGSQIYIQDESHPFSLAQQVFSSAQPVQAPVGMQGYTLSGATAFANMEAPVNSVIYEPDQQYTIMDVMVPYTIEVQPTDNEQIYITVMWGILGELNLPEEELIPYPPPPDVYSGPVIKIFVQWLNDGEFITGDDGLWFDPHGLSGGEIVIQQHRLSVPLAARDNADIHIGIYTPTSGERYMWNDGSDHLTIPVN